MKKNKSIAKNFSYDLLYKIVTLFTPLITTPYISRTIGASGIGSYSYTQSITSYFCIFASLGMVYYGQREIAYNRDNKKETTHIFWELTILRFFSVIFALTIYLGIIYFSKGINRTLFIIQTIDIICIVFEITWFYQGLEEFRVIFIRNLILKILCVSFIFLFVRTSEDLWLYVFLTSIAAIAGNLSMWISLKKYITLPKIKQLNIKRHLSLVFSLVIPQIALRVYDVLDKSMLGSLGKSSMENGYYEQASKIMIITITVVTSFSSVMTPRVAYDFANGNNKLIMKNMQKSFEMAWLLAIPIELGVMAIAINFVPWFFGTGYDKVSTLLLILCPVGIAMSIKNIIGVQYLISVGKQKLYTKSLIIGIVINMICNCLLIPRLYAIGAAVASLLSEYLVIAIQLHMIKNVISLKEILKSLWKKLLSGILMFACVYPMSRYFKPTIFYSAILICVGMGIYLGTLFILKDTFSTVLIKKILTKAKQILIDRM